MAIAEQDRLLYAMTHLPSGAYEDWDEWSTDFNAYIETGSLPEGSRFYNPNAPDTLDTGYVQGMNEVAVGPYSGMNEAQRIDAQRQADADRARANEIATLQDLTAQDRQTAYMGGISDRSNPSLAPLDPATTTQEEFYQRAFGVSGPAAYAEIREGGASGSSRFQDITSPGQMQEAYAAFQETGTMPGATLGDIQHGQFSENPAFLGSGYTDPVQSAYEAGYGGEGAYGGQYAYEPTSYGDFVNQYGGAMSPTNNPADWAGSWDDGVRGGTFTLDNAGAMTPGSYNPYEDVPTESLFTPGVVQGDNNYMATDAQGNPIPSVGGNAPAGPGLGGLQDLGSFVPGDIRTGTQEEVTADIFREESRLSDLIRRQQRGDILTTTDQWRDSAELRAAETRDYLRDYEGRALETTADFEAGLDTRGREYESTLANLYSPYTDRGMAADAERMDLAGSPMDVNVEQDPGYRFRMNQAQQALERQRSAAGTSSSGGAMREMGRYMQGLASQEYGAAYQRQFGEREQRLRTLADIGQQGARFRSQQGMQAVDPRANLQDRTGMLQNLAPTTADYGQIYSNRLGALTGTTQAYSDSLSGSLANMGANQAQILANAAAEREARRAGRRETLNTVLGSSIAAAGGG